MIGDYSGLRGERVAGLEVVGGSCRRLPVVLSAFLHLGIAGVLRPLRQHAPVPATIETLISTSWVRGRVHDRLVEVLKAMLTRGACRRGTDRTVFEQDEGAGDAPLGAFSPYGLSKGMTWQYDRYLCETMGFPLGNFVDPESVWAVRRAALLQLSDPGLVQGRGAHGPHPALRARQYPRRSAGGFLCKTLRAGFERMA